MYRPVHLVSLKCHFYFFSKKNTPSILEKKMFLRAILSPKLINIYRKVIYLYFYKYILQDKSIHMVLYFETQQLKSYSWFMFPMFDPNFIENDILFEYGESNSERRAQFNWYKTFYVVQLNRVLLKDQLISLFHLLY